MKNVKRSDGAFVASLNRRSLLIGSAALGAVPMMAWGQSDAEPARPSDAVDSLPPIRGFTQHEITTPRHRTAWIEAGPIDGPLMIFIHGWPETPLAWRPQMTEFAAAGYRCIAPFMRGYGRSSVPTEIAAYAVRETSTDMAELHDALGGEPAVWVGHDWGGPVAWAMASHHPERCRGVVGMTVPYMARGFTLPNLVALVDRDLYPESQYPYGQWDYWIPYRESFDQSARDYEADVEGVMRAAFQKATADTVGKQAFTVDAQTRGGMFGDMDVASFPADRVSLTPDDFAHMVAALEANGFDGPNAWYMNDEANEAFAQEAENFGRLNLPVLFLHAAWDTVVETMTSRLAKPMRADCADLTEAVVEAGHHLMLERPDQVNGAMRNWLAAKGLG